MFQMIRREKGMFSFLMNLIVNSILRIICRQMKTASDLDFGLLAKMTPGFVGADLQALATTAGVVTVRRISKIDEIAKQLDDKMDTDQPSRPPQQLPSLSLEVVE